MNQITMWLEEIAHEKHKAGLITTDELQAQENAFTTLKNQWRTLNVKRFQEVITDSNFGTYMTDAMSVLFYKQYETIGGDWRSYTTSDTSPDMRDVKRFKRTNHHRLQRRRATGSNRNMSISVAPITMGVSEFTEKFDVAWETVFNDDLGEIKKLPSDMALSAASSEDEFVSSLYHNAATQAYLISLGAKFAGASALDESSLQAAITAMTTRQDTYGRIINTGSLSLVMGKGLAYTSAKLFKDILSYGGANSNVLGNFINGIYVDPYLVADGTGNEPWYLIGNAIPTIPVLRVNGVDKPFVYTQQSQVRMVTGSAPAALTMGSYDTGVLSYTVESIIGGYANNTMGGIIDANGIYYNSGG